MPFTFRYLAVLLAVITLNIFVVAEGDGSDKDLIIEVSTKSLGSIGHTYQAGDITFEILPLFDNNSRMRKNWLIARPKTRTELTAWDLAHYLTEQQSDVLYAEPDYAHIDNYRPQAQKSRDCTESGYSNDWPHPQTIRFGWHLENGYSQLRSARQADTPDKVRIAHFDTGYDPNHIYIPKYMRFDLQRNFVDGENLYSAVDLGSEGLLNQPGHGTGTCAVLAGNHVSRPQNQFDDYVGGAPFAEIVPVRLSRSVILYKSSSFVKALYYIMEAGVACDVMSMSMGGVASKYWADGVNDAYEHGIVLVTAAGNNFGQLPTTHTVFPARFNRVISACGATYDYSPYFKYPLFDFHMQGNFGPDEVMSSAMAAYTPNVMWAKFGCVSQFDIDGGGTSCATPQIAAAAAQWLQKYRTQKYDFAWQRVNAVRHALFTSARKDVKDCFKYYGNGIVRAADALKIAPKLDSQPLDKDEVSFPIWTILFGRNRVSVAKEQMFAVELLRLEHNSRVLQQTFAAIKESGKATPEQRQIIRDTVAGVPYASQALRNLLSEK
jgi:hypothetical protein